MNYEKKTRKIVESFKGRLDETVLNDAVEYLDFREWGLALEILATQLYEYSIVITQSEFEDFETLQRAMNIPPNQISFLKKLIVERLEGGK